MYFSIKRIQQPNQATTKVLESLAFLRNEYPNFVDWYKKKVLPGLENGQRYMYVVSPQVDPEQIAGVLILKDTAEEKKICTLCVFPQYQKQHLGELLLNLAMCKLNEKKPFITVSSRHKEDFTKLFAKYNFTCFATYDGYYQDNHTEYAFNGLLEERKCSKKAANG